MPGKGDYGGENRMQNSRCMDELRYPRVNCCSPGCWFDGIKPGYAPYSKLIFILCSFRAVLTTR